MARQDVIDFARGYGYTGAYFAGPWRGYIVYHYTYNRKDKTIIDKNLIILRKGNMLRMSTEEEASAYYDEQPLG